jgi:hypothetical protein
VASRQSKASETLHWKGKTVSVDVMLSERLAPGPVHCQSEATVADCDWFYVT